MINIKIFFIGILRTGSQNLRNIRSIYEWIVENTDLGKGTTANGLVGTAPESCDFSNSAGVVALEKRKIQY
jgi:hypothetical protein